jgi:hypothetical protein
MRRWWVVIALLLSIGINLGLFAAILAARRAPPRGPAAADRQPPAVERLQKLADRLGLEGEPRQRFVSFQRRFFVETARDRRRLGAVNRQLRLELVGESPDPRRVEGLTAESSGLYLKLERALAANVLASRGLLDPRQERIYLDLIRQLRPGRGRLAPPGGPPAAPWRRGLERTPAPPAPAPPPG